jgi:hypothetical protein
MSLLQRGIPSLMYNYGLSVEQSFDASSFNEATNPADTDHIRAPQTQSSSRLVFIIIAS